MKKLIIVTTLIFLFSCKQKENGKQSIETVEQVEQHDAIEDLKAHAAVRSTEKEHANNGENKTDTVKIEQKGLTLYFLKKPFDTHNHKIDTNKMTIDGKSFFGTDGNLPDYELSEAYVEINEKRIHLETSGMYEPWSLEHYFKSLVNIKKTENRFLIFGIFSDGAGAYASEWLVDENSSERMKISRDESFIFKYQEE